MYSFEELEQAAETHSRCTCDDEPCHCECRRCCQTVPCDASRAIATAQQYMMAWEFEHRLRETLTRTARTRYGHIGCERCGDDTGLDAIVSSAIWREISPTGDIAGALCLWCMDEVAAEKGIKGPIPVYLYYRGQVFRSAEDGP